MNEKVKAWRETGDHLPEILRDPRDQRDIFEAMFAMGEENPTDCDGMPGQSFVINTFLWHMARYGYVLRKASDSRDFEDIKENTAAVLNQQRERLAVLLAAGEKQA